MVSRRTWTAVSFALAVIAAGCAPIARPAAIEIEITGLPENPEAVRFGTFKAVVQDKFRGRADLEFNVNGQKFVGQMQTIDESVTTSGRTATASQSAGIGVVGHTVGASQTAAQRQTASTQTTVQGSSKGLANALSDKGVTLSCDYIVNNKQFSGTGNCSMSNGAKYRMFAKPLRLLMTDGSSRPM